MSNIILAWQNWADGGTLSGGGWETSLPLSNMQNPSLSKVARSSSQFFFDTTFTIDFGAPRLINVVGIIGHTLTPESYVQTQIYTDSGLTNNVYDSGFVDTMPTIWGENSGALWGVDSIWTGKYAADELVNVNLNFFHIIPGSIVAQYVRINLNDNSNPNEWVDVARLFVGPAWEATYNYNVGATLGWRDLSTIDEGLSGAVFAEQRTKKRTFSFDLSFLSKNEVLSKAFEMQRRQGITKEVVVIPTPDEQTHQFREAFMGRLTTLSPIQTRIAGLHDVGFNIEELT